MRHKIENYFIISQNIYLSRSLVKQNSKQEKNANLR